MTEYGRVGRMEMSAGMIWAIGVEGSLGLVLVLVVEDSMSGVLDLWMRSGEGLRVHFWLRVMEGEELAEKGDNMGFRPLRALLVGVDGSASSDIVSASSVSFVESVEDGEEG